MEPCYFVSFDMVDQGDYFISDISAYLRAAKRLNISSVAATCRAGVDAHGGHAFY